MLKYNLTVEKQGQDVGWKTKIPRWVILMGCCAVRGGLRQFAEYPSFRIAKESPRSVPPRF
jgi:NADH:ubiquinone oxidoreductase subunit B-like Fe-S oxidoreductase